MSWEYSRKGYVDSCSGPHDGGSRLLPPPLSPAACMKITMHIMDDIMNRLYLRETFMIRWPNVRPTLELLSVDITCTEWFDIDDVGAERPGAIVWDSSVGEVRAWARARAWAWAWLGP